MMNIWNLGSKESFRVKFKDGICAKLCLKFWFKSDWSFCNITESGSNPNNHFLKPVWKSNCPEVYYRTLDCYFQSNDSVSASPYTVQSN